MENKKTRSRFALQNKFNRIMNVFINNRVSNWVKEFFDETPTYLYCDATGEYVYDFKTTLDLKIMRFVSEFTLTNLPEYGKQYSAYSWISKKILLFQINKAVQNDPDSRVFEWKKILTIEKVG